MGKREVQKETRNAVCDSIYKVLDVDFDDEKTTVPEDSSVSDSMMNNTLEPIQT